MGFEMQALVQMQSEVAAEHFRRRGDLLGIFEAGCMEQRAEMIGMGLGSVYPTFDKREASAL